MRKTTKGLIMLMVSVLFIITACKKDDSFSHMTQFELEIFNAVNNYRATKGLEKITQQYLLVDDAQGYSAKMASGTVTYGVEGVLTTLNTNKSNLGADGSGAVVQTCNYEVADSVLNLMLADPEKKRVLEGNFNQAAVGTATSSTGMFYVTELFLHISSK